MIDDDETELSEADRNFYARLFAAGSPAPVARSARPRTPQIGPDSAFAQSIAEQFARHKRDRLELERQVADLQRQVMEMRAELGVEQRMRELAERLDRIEAPRAPLRTVG